MTDAGSYERHYAYPLVTWGSTILGAVVALITAFMLNILGAALGIAVATFGQTGAAVATEGVIGMIWVGLANLVALGFGAWVAGRSTANPDHHGGTLQGIAVWAATSFVVLFLAGSAMAGLHAGAVQTADLSAMTGGAGAAPPAANSAANTAAAPDATQAPDTTQGQLTPQEARAAVKSVAQATASAAFGTFLAMVLGLVAAIFGARAGARHPNWADRPRYTYVERRH